jgi:hypothetical protein
MALEYLAEGGDSMARLSPTLPKLPRKFLR